jgi:glutamate dehydrogenase
MTVSAQTARPSKLAATIAVLSAGGERTIAPTFAERLFSDVDEGLLEAFRAEDLAAFARAAFESFALRQPGEAKVVLKSLSVGPAEFLVVDIIHDDMPFLLDSVLGQCRDLGLVPELVAHPIFESRRGANGSLMGLDGSGTGSNGAPRESLIHLQIRKTGPQPPAAQIEKALQDVLAHVRVVVGDFEAMTDSLQAAIERLEKAPPPASPEINEECLEFLKWLTADHFIFLGVREYEFLGDRETGQIVPRGDGLGLLRDMQFSVLRRGGVPHRLTAASRAFYLDSPPVTVAKANSVSTVHRRAHMDSIGIKIYDRGGNFTGETRIAGLFTASVYNLSTQNIPLLQRKTAQVARLSGHSPDSYSGRALMNVLETFPRDELFQISAEQLGRIGEEILKIDLAPRPRVFVRRDEFERFVSVFVYVPRDRYTTDVRIAITRMLDDAFDGRFDSFTPFFAESPMVRIHFVLWRKDRDLLAPGETDLEAKVEGIVRTWSDEFRDRILQHYGGAQGYDLINKYGDAFPPDYRDAYPPSRALEDMQRLEKLSPSLATDIDLYRETPDDPNAVQATMLQLDAPLPLSRRVPVLENFGFNVLFERTYRVTPKSEGRERTVYLHDSDLRFANGGAAEFMSRRRNLEKGFLAVWSGAAANDRFNALLLSAGLDWHAAALFRAYASYLRQTAVPYGTAYIAEVCVKHAAVMVDLYELFESLFNPGNGLDDHAREAARNRLTAAIAAKLDRIPVLDEDRILRNILALINATVRTNFWLRPDGVEMSEAIAFKLKSSDIAWLPAPKPFAEIFVSSPRFEGIHLRAAPIARGGLRWSDRPQDFRTEILGLAKAQQVKNVVIIPRGAKGGFVPRNLPKTGREAIQDEGIACYKSFISTLLSITDNFKEGTVVPPEGVVRRDGDDPYLVVAADKGTATFSDIANAISLGERFWLGDAFASGGSAGYDHKRMGITARGAWEAVKRHFREMNIDIQSAPFTVVGVGDMSGDVFGNGMLLSKAIRLVAAFDHRDIFVDPDPDPLSSWAERRRLFDLPRSSWQDYDRSKISDGGGVYSRGEKYVQVSERAQKLFGVGASATPNELITAIVKAPVDLLWFGGIGTYVRASAETDAQAGDKANDAVRATANELRARVIGEGANLAVTQRGRIEYASRGGRINTDAIDNSAGVNTSDVEVNIKIALGAAVASGKLDLEARNDLLKQMTDAVAASVLRNNYLQPLAISLAEKEGLADLGFQRRYLQRLEAKGILDRDVEALPSDVDIAQRIQTGVPLTRPELAVLLAYAKIDLENELIHSSVPDDPYLGKALLNYFPTTMRDRFAGDIERHPLRREIIATSLTNDIVNSGGPTFLLRLMDETGRAAGDVAYAYAAVMAVYDIPSLYAAVDALDGKLEGQAQLGLYRRIQDLLRLQTAWFLRHGLSENSLREEIDRYRDGVASVAEYLRAGVPGATRKRLADEWRSLEKEGVPADLARRLTALSPLSQALDAILISQTCNVPISVAASTVFAIREAFRLDDLAKAGEGLANGEYFDRLAVNSCIAAVSSAQRAIAKSSLLEFSPGGFEAWRQYYGAAAGRVADNIGGMIEDRSVSLAKLAVAVSQLRDLGAT